MTANADTLHILIYDLCNVVEEIIRHLAPKDNNFHRRSLIVGCMARGVSCLRSISLLCRNGFLTEPNMVLRNLVETHATLVDVMRNDKFHEYEYRSRYEIMKAFQSQEKALHLAIEEAGDEAEKERHRNTLRDVQSLVKLWDDAFRGFGKSMIQTGRWEKLPKKGDIYKVPSVEQVFKDSPLASSFLYDLPSSVAVHIKSATVWNDLVPIVSKSVYDTYEDGHKRRSNNAHMANAIQVSLVAGSAS